MQKIKDDSFYVLVACAIHVPMELEDKFTEMESIIKNVMVSDLFYLNFDFIIATTYFIIHRNICCDVLEKVVAVNFPYK